MLISDLTLNFIIKCVKVKPSIDPSESGVDQQHSV